MNLIHEVDLIANLAEFVFSVNQNQAVFGSDFSATLEQLASDDLNLFVVFLADKSLTDNLFLRDILIVTFFSLCRRCDDWLGKLLVFFHAVRNCHAADGVLTAFVSTPRTSGKVSADNHLNREWLAELTNCNHRIWSSDFPVRDDVGGHIQKLSCYLIENLAFIRNSLWQNNVESGDSVGGDHHQIFVVDEINITNLAVIYLCLTFEIEIGSS